MVLKTCKPYIAGCNREYKDRCCESMEEHVGGMLRVYSKMNSIRGAIKRAYVNYIEELMKSEGREGYSVEGLKVIIECDPIELVIALHDVGKCTQENQKSLEERCTAPHHEMISAAYLYSLSLSIDRQGPSVILPHMLAILLHHHSMRSLRDLSVSSVKINISKDDEERVNKCALLALKASSDTCSNLLSTISEPGLPHSIKEGLENVKRLISVMDKVNVMNEDAHVRVIVLAYGVAVRIAGVISILDRYVASINRSCGMLTERDMDRDVIEYLRRREAFGKAREVIRVLGM